MIFYERINLLRLISHIFNRRRAFYWKQSFILTFLWNLLPSFFSKTSLYERLNYCHVNYSTDVLKNSYLNGKRFVDNISHSDFLERNEKLFGLDFASVFKQFIFSEVVCSKYRFFELAIRYADEHPGENHSFYLNETSSDIYADKLKTYGEVVSQNHHNKMTFLFSLLLAPVFLWAYWRFKGQRNDKYFEDRIICYAPKKSTRDIFRQIFGDFHQAVYVMSYPYIDRYSQKELDQMGIIPLKLGRKDYLFLRKHLFKYLNLCLKFHKELSGFGFGMFRLFYHVIMGRERAPHGKNNIFVAFEHFRTTIAIRNEFIRLESSKSVFFPEWIYLTAQYNPNEVYHNYDFVCSSGREHEDTFLRKDMRIKNFLSVGSYEIHKKVNKDNQFLRRISSLSDFKGQDISITILSSAVTHETFNTEKPLRGLAYRLSRQQGIKVFIRIKDSINKSDSVMSKTGKFYHAITKDNPSILLTGFDEYDLLDFLSVTDLFITPNSTAGVTLVACGGQVIFADFDRVPDLFLFYEKIPGVCVPGDKVFDEVMDWVRDKKDGVVRSELKNRMNMLSDYLGYTFPDFASYKENLIGQLSSSVPFFPKRDSCEKALA